MSYFVPESIVVPLLDVSKVEYACHTLASAEAEVRALLLDFKLVLDRTLWLWYEDPEVSSADSWTCLYILLWRPKVVYISRSMNLLIKLLDLHTINLQFYPEPV